MNVARQVAQQLARFQSKFEGTQAELVRQRVIPPRPADVSGLPIELLIILRESFAAQRLAFDVLVKSATSSGVGTSLATQEMMRLLTDPDAAMKDKFVHGEVTLDEASPFELLPLPHLPVRKLVRTSRGELLHRRGPCVCREPTGVRKGGNVVPGSVWSGRAVPGVQ